MQTKLDINSIDLLTNKTPSYILLTVEIFL